MVHKCSECDARSGQISSLFHHIRTVHKAAGGFTCQECNYRAARKDNLHRHVKSKHSDVKASTANRTPVPNIIDLGNNISAQDIELMELTHDVAFSQYSDLLQISDDEQPPIKKSAKSKISKTLSIVQIARCRQVLNLNLMDIKRGNIQLLEPIKEAVDN